METGGVIGAASRVSTASDRSWPEMSLRWRITHKALTDSANTSDGAMNIDPLVKSASASLE